jgi:tetratricopeptide (TPR) repeat protein
LRQKAHGLTLFAKGQLLRIAHLLLAAALAAFPVVLTAAPLPKPEDVVQPVERPLLPKLREALGQADRKGSNIPALDQLLAELREPSPLRGLVQFFRSMALATAERIPEAREAILESIRLLPNYSAPLFVASQQYAFNSSEPSIAVDYFLRASSIDPQIVELLDDYGANNMLGRLAEVNDHRRAILLSERLLKTGWSKGQPATLSRMAMNILEARIDEGNVAGATEMVTKIVSPSAFARLLTEKKFAPLRRSVVAWTGPQLEKQWPIYLDQTRAAWEASRDLDAGHSYARALALAGHDQTLVSTFLPLFRPPIDLKGGGDLAFIAPVVSQALARLGRWDEAYQILDDMAAAWPDEFGDNILNVTANRARLLVEQGRFTEAAAAFDAVLKNVEERGGVNVGAFAVMHLYRACALQQLGRATEEVTSSTVVMNRRLEDPVSAAHLHLCRNDHEAARRALIEGLEGEATRAEVLDNLQPRHRHPSNSDFARKMAKRWDRLRADPRLIEAAERHGRILGWPINVAVRPGSAATGG